MSPRVVPVGIYSAPGLAPPRCGRHPLPVNQVPDLLARKTIGVPETVKPVILAAPQGFPGLFVHPRAEAGDVGSQRSTRLRARLIICCVSTSERLPHSQTVHGGSCFALPFAAPEAVDHTFRIWHYTCRIRSLISPVANIIPRIFRIMDISAVTARTLQGMAASGPGRLRPGPWSLTGVSAVVSRVKRDFACTLAGAFPPVLVALRAQSRLRLEGRTRTLSGPSPDLTSPASGLLGYLTHVRQAMSQCLRYCPGVTVVTLGRLSHRAREGHGF